MKIDKSLNWWHWFEETWNLQSALALINEIHLKFNLDRNDIAKLKELMLPSDINLFLAGCLKSIYPSGYPIFHPCINVEKGTCTHNIVSQRDDVTGDFLPDSVLNFNRLERVDDTYLTLEDREFMSKQNGEHTKKEILEYQARLASKTQEDCRKKVIWEDETGASITTVFKTPNVNDYLTSSKALLDGINTLVNKALSSENDLSIEARSKRRGHLITTYKQVHDMVKHSHWVDYIIVKANNGHEITITDNKSIIDTLKTLDKQHGIKERLEKGVQYFKENSIIAMTGINNFECPVCKTSQTDKGSKYPTLIPFNVVSCFFSIMGWRVQTRHGYTP
jgi:hypothetical protein